jgi:hypothetical protein
MKDIARCKALVREIEGLPPDSAEAKRLGSFLMSSLSMIANPADTPQELLPKFLLWTSMSSAPKSPPNTQPTFHLTPNLPSRMSHSIALLRQPHLYPYAPLIRTIPNVVPPVRVTAARKTGDIL